MPTFSTTVLLHSWQTHRFLRHTDSVAGAGGRFRAFRGEVRLAMEDQKLAKLTGSP